jgi:HSP20 family molecular chaperone IbpA
MFGELTSWNPSQELSRWHRDIDNLFDRFFGGPETSLGGWMPRIETYRKDNDYVVRLDLPGVDPKDVQIHAEGNVLSISGDKIAARCEHGVLEIRVPVPGKLAGRKIPIEIAQKENKKKLDNKAA